MFRRFKPIPNPTQISFRHSSSPSNPNQEHQNNQNCSILPLDLSQAPLASATAIAEREGLLTKILIKLPPKSILRFQCVSKKWLSMISDPAFRRRHWRTFRKNPNSDILFFSPDSENNEVDFISLGSEGVSSMGTLTSHLREDFLKNDILRVQSSNGLWCMQLKDDCNRISLVVCNPTTCKHRKILIPVKSHGTYLPIFRYSNIAFNPLKSDHYKLVCVGIDRDQYRFMVYSSESGAWGVIDDAVGEVTFDNLYYFDNGVFWNGDLHFIGIRYSTLCFDVDNEKIRLQMPRIPTKFNNWDANFFGEAGGDLCVMSLNNRESKLLFDVFALKRDYSEWVVKYRVDFAPLTGMYPEIGRGIIYTPWFVVDEDERGKKARIAISLKGKLISYDISNMVVKELVEVVPPFVEFEGWGDGTSYKWYEVCKHVETFALV